MDFVDANRAMLPAHHFRLGRRNSVPRSIASLHMSCDTWHRSKLVRKPLRIGRISWVERSLRILRMQVSPHLQIDAAAVVAKALIRGGQSHKGFDN